MLRFPPLGRHISPFGKLHRKPNAVKIKRFPWVSNHCNFAYGRVVDTATAGLLPLRTNCYLVNAGLLCIDRDEFVWFLQE